MRFWSWLAILAVSCGIVHGQEVISFDAIRGAKRWDKSNRVWELAIAKPVPLFPNQNQISRPLDVTTAKGYKHLLTLPFWPQAEVDFTCAIQIDSPTRGTMTMVHRNQRNSIVQEWDEDYDGSGWVYFSCRWPRILMDKQENKFEMRIFIRTTKPVTVRRISLYQTVGQIFNLKTPYPVRGIFYRHFLSGKELEGASLLNLDGIRGARIVAEDFPLVESRSGGPRGGLLMPVDYPNGCQMLWRTYGEITLITYGDSEKKESKLYRQMIKIGASDQWTSGIIGLDTAELDRDHSLIWNGQIGEQHNLLISTRGRAVVDFVALVPQNRLDLPKDHQFKRLEFRFRDTSGMWSKATFDVPPNATALGLVNRNPGIQILWNDGKQWKLDGVLRAYQDSSLVIRESSMVFY